jgi:hypothetical protein
MHNANKNQKPCGGRTLLLKWPGLGKIPRLSLLEQGFDSPQEFVAIIRIPANTLCLQVSGSILNFQSQWNSMLQAAAWWMAQPVLSLPSAFLNTRSVIVACANAASMVMVHIGRGRSFRCPCLVVLSIRTISCSGCGDRLRTPRPLRGVFKRDKCELTERHKG